MTNTAKRGMSNVNRIVLGLVITTLIFVLAIAVAKRIDPGINFFPNSFITHTTMLFLSLLVIVYFKKQVKYVVKWPTLRKTLRPILFGVVATIVVNIVLTVITLLLGNEPESHPLMLEMTPWQIFIFVFIYASIAEEMLFRGFLLNFLQPLAHKGISIFRRKISLPVIISAIAFGLSHLILMSTGANTFFVVRIVIFTTTLGIIAGYYQEKHTNNAYAIIVHMAGNLMGLLGAIGMSLSNQ